MINIFGHGCDDDFYPFVDFFIYPNIIDDDHDQDKYVAVAEDDHDHDHDDHDDEDAVEPEGALTPILVQRFQQSM